MCLRSHLHGIPDVPHSAKPLTRELAMARHIAPGILLAILTQPWMPEAATHCSERHAALLCPVQAGSMIFKSCHGTLR